jgi:2-phosphosulfolactate phosphatase
MAMSEFDARVPSSVAARRGSFGGAMVGKRTVKIDAFPESAFRCLEYDAIVCIDVICATTTAVTSVVQGRRAFSVAEVEQAFAVARGLDNPLLVGESKGARPAGFEMRDSPAALSQRTDVDRPMVLASPPGTRLIINSTSRGSKLGPDVYLACLRNMTPTAEALAARYARVALLGAGAKGEFRSEDQMNAAWIAGRLLGKGFEPEDDSTAQLIERWSHSDVSLVGWGNSAETLRQNGQIEDLDFIMEHVDDTDLVCQCVDGEVTRATARPRADVLRRFPTGPAVVPKPVSA